MMIRARLTLTYAGAIALTLVLAGLAVWWQLGVMLRSSLAQTLETRAVDVATSLENTGQVGLQESNAPASGIFVVLLDTSGQRLDASTDAPASLPSVAAGSEAQAQLAGGHYMLRAVAAPNGGVVVAGSSLASIDRALASLAQLLAGVALVAGLASLLGGWWLAGRALRPVAALTREAAAIDAGDLDRRLPESTTQDEIGQLARTLNGMLARIERSVRQQRAFVATASHDLRTPLAALQTELELAQHPGVDADQLRTAIDAAHGDVIRLGAFATALLELASADIDGRTAARKPVPTTDLVASVLRQTAPLAAARGIVVTPRVSEAIVDVDRVRLEQAITNLVSNAVQYSPPGSSVELAVALDAGEAQVTAASTLKIEVLDRGPGLPDVVREHLFEPFWRGPHETSPGFGLGLATAAAAVRAHGGEIGAEPRDGAGTRFWLRVPAGDPHADDP